MLIDTFATISQKKECRLTQVGTDYLNGKIQQYAQSKGQQEKISFKGFYANEELPSFYAKGDILLHTSLFESQAMVVCEAMASGVVVCGTHVGIMADLAPDCCLTVSSGDAEGLAEKVLQLLENPAQFNRLRQNAYQWALEYNIDWTAIKHKEIYVKLVLQS